MKRILNARGASIIELIIVISLLSLISVQVSLFTRFIAQNGSRLQDAAVCDDLAAGTLDFCAQQFKMANAYSITHRTGACLRQLDLYTQVTPGVLEHHYIISYDPARERLDFGGQNAGLPGVNEAASGVTRADFQIDEKAGVMNITVTVRQNGSSRTMRTAVDITHKEVR